MTVHKGGVVSPSIGPASFAGPGRLFELISTGQATTRGALRYATGLSRSTVGMRVDELIDAGYLRESGVDPNVRGRPSVVLSANPKYGHVLIAALGATHARIAVSDANGTVIDRESAEISIAQGPDSVLTWIAARWRGMLQRNKIKKGSVIGVGVTIPGPVNVETGRPDHPPIMPGWNDYDIRGVLEAQFKAPCFVENDANAMAFGEYRTRYRDCPSLLLVKASTGIGSGMVVDGRLVRGADGASGDIGHIKLGSSDDGPVCACGARGCLAASASGGAQVGKLQELGYDVTTTSDVVRLAQGGNPDAVAMIREAGLLLGEVLSTAVSLMNPRILLVTGSMTHAQQHFTTGLRERLYQRTQPVATRHLEILTSRAGADVDVTGAACVVTEALFSADSIDRSLRERAEKAQR